MLSGERELKMNFEKLTVEEFTTLIVACSYSSILLCAKINDRLIHISAQDVLKGLENKKYSELGELSLPTFYSERGEYKPLYGVSGRWRYTFIDGFFIRTGREGRCS